MLVAHCWICWYRWNGIAHLICCVFSEQIAGHLFEMAVESFSVFKTVKEFVIFRKIQTKQKILAKIKDWPIGGGGNDQGVSARMWGIG